MKKVISIVGAGGKTTLAHSLARKYQSNGDTVLLTTMTHMKIEDDTDLSGDFQIIRDQLAECGYCMAGLPCRDDAVKMCGLPEDLLRKLLREVDVTIIEADGAKHHSVKYPAAHEPVILPFTTDVIVVMGTWDIGKKCKDAVFRHELMERELGISPEAVVDEEMICLLERVYANKLKQTGFCGRLHYVRREEPVSF